ncbi:MAG: polysaccharide deacetylase family protein [Elusimicrobiota bacterium]|jgi:peptidoglycan/xylan/chitin deacetylase (PgdA/CDA1 family)
MTYLPILTYHRLLAQEPSRAVDPNRIAVSQTQFRRHLAWFKRLGYRSVPLSDYVRLLLEKRPLPTRGLAITFDDGYEEVLTLGLPVLQEFGFSSTVFAITGEERNAWDNGSARILSGDQLRHWRKAGMDVGGHTCHHVHLPQLTPDAARREIRESKKQLEDLLGETIPIFAYPYGESTPAVEQMVRDAGYEVAFATDRAPRDHAANLYRLRRTVIFPRNTAWEVLWKAQRWYPAYQDWKRGTL